MFSCCFRVRGGSDLKTEKSRGQGEGCGGARRSWVQFCLQCLWPFGQKENTLSQDSQDQDRIDQVEKESLLSPQVEKESLLSPQVEKESLLSPQVEESAPIVLKNTSPEERKESFPNNFEESGPKDTKERGPKEPSVFAPNEPKEFCLNTLDVLVDNMLTAVKDGDRNSLIAYLCIYPMYATIQQILDVLFRRYAYFRPGCEEDEEVKNIICTLLHTWMDEFPGDFSNTTNLPVLKKVKTYLMLNIPYSDLLVRFHEIHTSLEEEVDSDSEDSE